MKATKRILAVMLAVMLVLALSAVTVSAEGEETPPTTPTTLVVTGETLKGQTVTIVPIFEALDTDERYRLYDEWKAFFAAKTEEAATSDFIASKAYAYMVAQNTYSKMRTFAADAKTYYDTGSAATPDKFAAVRKTVAVGATDTSATFTDIAPGSYLVIPTNKDDDIMVVNVEKNQVLSVGIKSEYPTVDKKVDTDGSGTYTDEDTAKIGDAVTFQLTSTVPNMTDYQSYQFEFVDTMSEGLTYVADSVNVTIGTKTNAALVAANDYTVTEPDYTTTPVANVLKVTFADLKAVTGIKAGDTITVTYNAKINEKAVAGANTNSAKVVYSNDPTDTSKTGESTPDESKVYTYKIVLNKYTGTETNYLAGAVFEIYNTDPSANGATPIKLVADTAADTYHVATPEEIADNTVTKTERVVSSSTGPITVNGFNLGKYYVKEVVAPIGYNILTAPVEITIAEKVTNGVTDYEHPNYTVKTNEIETTGTNSTANIENVAGPVLPTTGGVGTIIFTVLGVGVIIAGVVFTSRKKKEDK